MDKVQLDFLKGLNCNTIMLPQSLWEVNFFPDYTWHFVVLTDDEIPFICSREELNGKGIYSTLKQSSFGEYFRNRLGLPNGSFITKDHLLEYGRTDVDFYKIDDETYSMDFSLSPTLR
jgi:hypothetical protein